MNIYTTITVTKITPVTGINPLQFLVYLPDRQWYANNLERIEKIERDRAKFVLDRERLCARNKRNDCISVEEVDALHLAYIDWINRAADLLNEVYSQFSCGEIADAILRSSVPDISQCN